MSMFAEVALLILGAALALATIIASVEIIRMRP